MDKASWWKRAFFVLLVCMPETLSGWAQTFGTLHTFDGADGANPHAGLVQATDGNLHGTTYVGGANSYGTDFKISPSGTLTTLYSFCSQGSCTDGSYPSAALIQARDGRFYGTSVWGGALGNYGTVFEITPSGTLTTLHSFDGSDGANPNGPLVQATDGNFYGTTLNSGANLFGTVFKISPAGKLTTLYNFCSQSNCLDGRNPYAALIQATDGNFYGTVFEGGADSAGAVFKITPDGTLTTLYSFDGSDGANPSAALVQGADGSLYGTTSAGWANGGGTVFKLTLAGTLTTLYDFCSQSSCADGGYSSAALIQASDGRFYGTAVGGGAFGYGTVFDITSSSTFTTLHSFNHADGASPEAPLVQNTNGKLYGTTLFGGNGSACEFGCGTVFEVSVGLGPFVETEPSYGKVGAAVKILGTNLTGTTSVTFYGTPAIFTVRSKTLISATVPAGATSGAVEVVTPGRTLSSNVSFKVVP